MIRIGTRGSALALAQARWVAERVSAATEVVPITTSGDRGAPVGDKSRWTSELERALLEERVDVAVHSAKDVPAELAPELELIGFCAREDPRDAICGVRSLDELAPGARVGTSSLRRQAQLLASREDLEVVALHGNVDTRLRKLAAGEVEALVLAAAGLRRLGHRPDGILDQLVPAAGQGALALECRVGEVPADLGAVVDAEATRCVRSERELTAALGASCNTPIGAHARAVNGAGELELSAWVGSPDGSAWIADRLSGAGAGLGQQVAERLLSAGAAELLA